MQSAKQAAGRRVRDNCVQSANNNDGASHSSSEEHELDDDTYRVRGLAHCDVMLDWLARQHSLRLRGDQEQYQSAANAHLAQHGHELAFGCCRPV